MEKIQEVVSLEEELEKLRLEIQGALEKLKEPDRFFFEKTLQVWFQDHFFLGIFFGGVDLDRI